MRPSKASRLSTILLLLLLPGIGAAEDRESDAKEQILREKTRLLRKCPKRYATFRGLDRSRREVELLMEGEEDSRVWKIEPDAEVKVHGFWGRLEELRKGDRVWAWIRLDRKKRPVSIFMLADEVSEQVIHRLPYALESIDLEKQTLSIGRKGDETRTLKLASSVSVTEEDGAFVFGATVKTRLHKGDSVYVQSSGDSARLVVGAAGLEELRAMQRSSLRDRWRREGLPGTVTFLHGFSGEVEIVLDHEAMRWARNLEVEDLVEVNLPESIESAVLEISPWRERTRLRLVVDGFAQSDLAIGQRLFVRVAEPPPEVTSSKLPPDLDRERSRQDRIAWFLASSYCGCSIAGDGCTGMFYTLAGCNPKTCGMPKRVRGFVGGLIDEAKTDREIFEALEEKHGPQVLKPHLLR